MNSLKNKLKAFTRGKAENVARVDNPETAVVPVQQPGPVQVATTTAAYSVPSIALV